jgi:enamine deaminase RidA (YjgF/YER057c/UK114 family)
MAWSVDEASCLVVFHPWSEHALRPKERFAPRAASCLLGRATMTPEQNLARLRLVLPAAPRPVAVYRPLVVVQGLAYVSGHGPVQADGSLIKGRVGADLDLAQGHAAARQVGLAILATLRTELGSLDRVGRVIKLLGMVNSAPDFLDHPRVINGCSELFAEVFGPERGIGARSAVGMGPLPGNIAVEIEAIFELAPP